MKQIKDGTKTFTLKNIDDVLSFLSSNIPISTAYGVFVSELCAMVACTVYRDFSSFGNVLNRDLGLAYGRHHVLQPTRKMQLFDYTFSKS